MHVKTRIILALVTLVTALPAAALAAPDVSPDAAPQTCAFVTADLDGSLVTSEPPTVPGPCPGIRPGARMTSPSGCTFNFVFRDVEEENLYIGTAGHCVDAVGQRVSASGVGDFGTVAFSVDAGTGNDFALVLIDPAKHGQVDAAMCHWGGPERAESDAVALGDDVKQYGHGTVFGESTLTRPREGAIITWEDTQWSATLAITPGDSGSPLLFADGGGAGVVTHLSVGTAFPGVERTAATAAGTRLSHAVTMAEGSLGIDLELVTAPLA